LSIDELLNLVSLSPHYDDYFKRVFPSNAELSLKIQWIQLFQGTIPGDTTSVERSINFTK
jgi:hypothetical protein